MRLFRIALIAGMVAAGSLMMASPSFAITWKCTATNAQGKSFTASANGPVSWRVRDRAARWARDACYRYPSAVCSTAVCSPS